MGSTETALGNWLTMKKPTFVTIFSPGSCTDKEENIIFLIKKEVQKGSVAKSYGAKASSYMTKYLSITSYY